MNYINVATACLLFVSSSVSAEQQTANAKSAEVFRVPPYPSEPHWKEITNKKDDRTELVEWIPADQTENTIKDILTKQIFYNLKDADPSAFVSGILKGVGKACERARVNGPKEQTENGYSVAYAQAYCANQKGAAKDVDIFIKAIRGTDALDVVQREFRRPAQPGATPGITTFSKDQVEEMKTRLTAQNVANKFLVEDVQLCPLTGGTGTCGQTATPASLTAPVSPFVEGKSTAEDVKTALGKPEHENHNPDGRFFYGYSSPNGMVTYLFDSKGVLIRIRGYKMK